jgi:hypothetical protein
MLASRFFHTAAKVASEGPQGAAGVTSAPRSANTCGAGTGSIHATNSEISRSTNRKYSASRAPQPNSH